MANHKILVTSSEDSDVLNYVDLTDGTYSSAEFQHTEAIDGIYTNGNDVYLYFDGRGGRVAKTTHDGQLPPPEQDLTPAGPRTYPSTPSFGGISENIGNLGNGLKIVRGGTPNPSGGYDFDGTWAVKKADGTDVALFGQSSKNYDFMVGDDMVRVWAMLLSVWSDAGSLPTASNVVFNEDGSFWVGATGWITPTPGGNSENHNRIYKLKFANPLAPVDTEIEVLEVVDLGAVSNWDQMLNNNAPSFIFPNGNIGFGVGSYGYYMLDPVTKVATLQAIDKYNPSSSIAACINSGKTSWGSVDVPYDNYAISVSFTSFDYVARPDLSASVVTSEVFSLSPQTRLNFNNIGMADGKYFIMLDNYVDEGAPEYDSSNPPEPTKADKLLVFDSLTGQYAVINLLGTATHGKICGPKTELYFDYFGVVELQPYKVEGNVSNAGGTKATELILIDNTSMRICGRTASDPITGAYKFRCYNPGKKSVLAKHPKSGGFSISAEVTPVAE